MVSKALSSPVKTFPSVPLNKKAKEANRNHHQFKPKEMIIKEYVLVSSPELIYSSDPNTLLTFANKANENDKITKPIECFKIKRTTFKPQNSFLNLL